MIVPSLIRCSEYTVGNNSLIRISNITLGDAYGDPLELEEEVVGASVTVTGQVNPVPEPASAALLVVGLLGLLL
ncbi:hypothetical protein RZS08_24500, partial [Arthrospira platensis SPKY1]|nr:hypothetical protein [Arthrospira platensis SPKY1]